MKPLTRVVAAIVDVHKAVLYKENGETVEILQGDERLRPILEHITPLLSTQRYADIDLSVENSWLAFEEKSSGFRFFKVAKEKLKEIFSAKQEAITPQVVGILPQTKNMRTVEEIMKYATPVTDTTFTEDKVAAQRPTVETYGSTPNDRRDNTGAEQYYDKHPDTIVAVTPSGTVVPGVERIKSQFTDAANRGSTKGLEVFMTRLGKVIEKRSHTVEDLLRFMERGDMPVAEDGSIIIFKRLHRTEGDNYVDAHSRKVKQRVGSYVFMREALVDPNRRNECSNGLHVARRGYISGFSGDVVVLAKVRPEGVIAVPDYDANKMRVCGYHIIAQLNEAQFKAVCSNRPISDAEGGSELMASAISGKHIGIIEHVEIGSAMGGNLKITPQVHKENSSKAKRIRKKAAKKKAAANKNKGKKVSAPIKGLEVSQSKSDDHVDIKKVVAKTKDPTTSLAKAVKAPITQQEIVNDLWQKALAGDLKSAKELIDFKKKAKKGWGTWDLPNTAGDTLKALVLVE